MARGKFWMTSEMRFVRCNLHRSDAELAVELGRTTRAVAKFRKRSGMMKDPNWAAARRQIWQERRV